MAANSVTLLQLSHSLVPALNLQLCICGMQGGGGEKGDFLPLLMRIWGECLTIHSPPAFFFFFEWKLAYTHTLIPLFAKVNPWQLCELR